MVMMAFLRISLPFCNKLLCRFEIVIGYNKRFSTLESRITLRYIYSMFSNDSFFVKTVTDRQNKQTDRKLIILGSTSFSLFRPKEQDSELWIYNYENPCILHVFKTR